MSIGVVLAAARRRAGLSVAQVSQQTRIGETAIVGIEDDDYSACGGDFDARGHIRAIAAAVGADPGPLIAAYDSARLGGQALAGEVTEPLTPVRVAARGRPGQVTPTGMPQQRPPAGPVTPPGRRQRRRWPAWAVLGVALAAGFGFAGYQLGGPGGGGAPSAGAHPAMASQTGRASRTALAPEATGSARAATAPAVTAPAAAPPRALTPASVTAFGSSGSQGDNSDLARLAIDGNPATAWHTDWYATAQFGNLYPGTGLLVDMGRPVTITAARITLGPAHGASFQLRASATPALASLRPVAHAAGVGGVVWLRLTRPVHGRYVLIWFTRLPLDPAGTFQASVYDLQLVGRA